MSDTPRQSGPAFKNIALLALLVVIGLMAYQMITAGSATKSVVSYSDFMESVEQGRVTQVHIDGNEITGTDTNRKAFSTTMPEDPNLVAQLRGKKVAITVEPVKETPLYLTILVSWFPMLLLIGVWVFFMRQMQGGGKTMSFGKSRARLLTQEEKKFTFADVAGIEEAKEEVTEIVEFLRSPKKFTKLGGRIPKGVLLVGSPGTGKTLLARAIAGEAGVPFFSISGSDFVEMFVGVGASRVRDLFIQGKKNAPCIIFIDEIDAVGRHRGAGLGGGHDEREQTLNQLLVEMDGFESAEGVILVAATNRPDVLDPALLRPGRFDRQVVIPRPDINGRQAILAVHARNVPLAEDVKLEVIARGTPGFSGADLENLVNEAALTAARREKDAVGMPDFEMAKDKVLMGAERRSMVLSDKERSNSAYHEAGHALAVVLLPNADPIHKVSIIPRGRALGVTMYLPIDDRHTYSRDYLVDLICVSMGGRAAEEIVLGQMTTGAVNDIEKATEVARKMVCKWGMSEELGPLAWGREEEQVFLGKELSHQKDYSELTARKIDEEVRRLVEQGMTRARELVTEHRDALERLAQALLERETLDAAEVVRLINGEEEPPVVAQDTAEAAEAVEAVEEGGVDVKV